MSKIEDFENSNDKRIFIPRYVRGKIIAGISS